MEGAVEDLDGWLPVALAEVLLRLLQGLVRGHVVIPILAVCHNVTSLI